MAEPLPPPSSSVPPPSAPAPLPEADETPRQWRKLATKAAVLLAVVAVGLWLFHSSEGDDLLREARPWAELVQSWGIYSRVGFVLVVAALTALGVPRLLFCPVGGMAFGFVEGLLLATTGAVLSSYTVFLFFRGTGRAPRWPLPQRVQRLVARLRNPGLGGVVLVRLLPVHGLAATVALALTQVSHRNFLLGTALGMLPEAIPATYLGVGVVDPELARSAKGILTAAALLVASVVVLGILLRLARKGKG